MDGTALSILAFVLAIMSAATPILLAALGELVAEKAGVLNLGVEGMMICGAIAGFATAVTTGSPLLGILGGAFGGVALSLIFGVLTQYFLSNQVATGLGLTMAGLGIAALVGQPYAGIKPPDFPALSLGLTGRVEINPMVPFSLFLVACVAWFLARSRGGMILRAVGENHDAAHSLGYHVIRIRLLAIAFGGACAGMGGAYLSLIRVPQWTEGMTAGVGWIALAIVVFASWRPWGVVIGAYLFGGVTIIQLTLQARGWDFLRAEYMSMAPYLATIAVLVIISARKSGANSNAPACLGQMFEKSG